jgi:polysaccharide biosynthesis/export protein
LKKYFLISAVLLVGMLSGCRTYRANIMFQSENGGYGTIKSMTDDAKQNYKISVNDYISVEVFTNHGERIIDPDFELTQGMQGGLAQNRTSQRYLVMDNGYAKLPLVGDVMLAGSTLYEAEKILEARYNEYYNDVYVSIKYLNKRVIVLGAMGGHVVTLNNENMNLLEVLALAGGINDNSKSYNIRLIRGDLDNPEVQFIDLSTIEGMKRASLKVFPEDVIYVEPVRRAVPETLRDISPILSLFSTVITMFVLVRSL